MKFFNSLRTLFTFLGQLTIWLFVVSSPVMALDLVIEIEVPEIDTVEYHRPYVAVWIENAERQPVQQVTLWLQKEKWHRDLRSWWRRGGKNISIPLDGVSGATRKPGNYTVTSNFDLPEGHYILNVEAVREVGGREHLRLPFEWQKTQLTLEKSGTTELGKIAVTFTEVTH